MGHLHGIVVYFLSSATNTKQDIVILKIVSNSLNNDLSKYLIKKVIITQFILLIPVNEDSVVSV